MTLAADSGHPAKPLALCPRRRCPAKLHADKATTSLTYGAGCTAGRSCRASHAVGRRAPGAPAGTLGAVSDRTGPLQSASSAGRDDRTVAVTEVDRQQNDVEGGLVLACVRVATRCHRSSACRSGRCGLDGCARWFRQAPKPRLCSARCLIDHLSRRHCVHHFPGGLLERRTTITTSLL